MDTSDCAWLAGFFDGEGCVSGYVTGYRNVNVSIQIVQKDRAVLDRITSILGMGSIGRFKSGVHCWRVTGRVNVLRFVEIVEPYAVVKREKLLLARELALTISPKRGGAPVSAETRKRRVDLANKMRVRGRDFADVPGLLEPT